MRIKNKLMTADEAVAPIKDGATIMVGGFGNVGTPEILIDALVRSGARNLTVISCDAGRPGCGVGKLLNNNQIKKLIASHIGLNPDAGKMINAGKLEYELIPQGTMAEQLRAAGVGLGGILTSTGIGTIVSNNKQKININNKEYLLELPIKADFALIRGHISDKSGNTVYYGTAINFNPLMAAAATHVIVGACKVVDVGEIDPNHVVTPGIFVNAVVGGEKPWKI